MHKKRGNENRYLPVEVGRDVGDRSVVGPGVGLLVGPRGPLVGSGVGPPAPVGLGVGLGEGLGLGLGEGLWFGLGAEKRKSEMQGLTFLQKSYDVLTVIL
jgi:hypothetical protein